MSTIKIAKSAKAPPRLRSDVNAACPGVSTKNKPGIVSLIDNLAIKSPHISLIVSIGISVAPMCWVIPPASLSATVLPLI